MSPQAADVAAYLGKGDDADVVALAGTHLPYVTLTVKAYVRGNGFDDTNVPADDLAAVIVSATARSITNPEALQTKETAIDDAHFTERYGIFNGWTLAELAILHRYRKRAL